MKRFLTATAIATLVATGATAQSNAEADTIERYLPRINVETLTDTQVTQLMAVARGSESEGEKAIKMRALVSRANMLPIQTEEYPIPMDVTNAERAQIERYLPRVNVDTLTDAQVAELIAVARSSESEGDKAVKMRALVSRSNMTPIETTDYVVSEGLTEAERIQIERYAPTLDVTTLSDLDIQRLQTAINGGNRSDIERVINSIEG